jgi:hypothetical protein
MGRQAIYPLGINTHQRWTTEDEINFLRSLVEPVTEPFSKNPMINVGQHYPARPKTFKERVKVLFIYYRIIPYRDYDPWIDVNRVISEADRLVKYARELGEVTA